MIKVNIYNNDFGDIYKFIVFGHANFSESGSDIVCSAVSVLVINTINCIDKFTDEIIQLTADEVNGGYIEFEISNGSKRKISHDTELLLKTLDNGLREIQKEYGCYIKINDRRCGKC